MAELVGAPIELVVIEFPGSQFNGEILPSIAQLIDDRIVTLLDALLVTKDDDGTVVSLEISDLGEDEQAAFDQLDGEAGGLLSDSDVEAVGESLSPGSSALLLVWEDTWAGRVIDAVVASGGRLVAHDRLVPRPCARLWPNWTNWTKHHLHEQIEQRKQVPEMMRRGIGRVGRRPLARTMARTAVVAGTATAVVGGMSRHQQGKDQQAAEAQAYEQQQQDAAMQAAAQQAVAAQQAAAPPPPPAAPAAPDSVAELERLAQLKAQGVLSDEEFTAAKAKLLGL